MGRGHVAIKVFSFRTESEWTMLHSQGCRSHMAVGGIAPQILADQLILYQSGRADYAPLLRIFRHSYGPALSWLRVGSYISFRIFCHKESREEWVIYIQIQWPSHLYLLSKTKGRALVALKSTQLMVNCTFCQPLFAKFVVWFDLV